MESTSCDHCHLAAYCNLQEDSNPRAQNSLGGRHISFKKQSEVCRKQEKADALYIVKVGVLKTCQLEPSGRERIMQFYLPGEILGFEAINQGFFPHTVQTLTSAVLCEISFEHLLKLSATRLTLQRLLFKLISQRLNLREYVISLRAEQRVAGFLLELNRRLHCSTNTEFKMPMSRQAIGDYLGLSVETIIRIINNFHSKQLLAARNKQIKLLDLSKLQWLSQGGQLDDYSI